MYYYAEYLRARSALRVALILLGLLLLVGIIVRVSIHGPSANDMAARLEQSPTARVIRTRLPDGSTRLVVDDPARRTHAVIMERGSSVRMDVTEPEHSARSEHATIVLGSIDMNENAKSGVSHVTLTSNSGISYDLGLLFLGSILMGLIVATLLGGVLAKENDGHLELTWTKPVSREAYAMASFAVDSCAIVLSQLLAIGCVLLGTLLFAVPRFQYGPHVGWNIAIALLGPLAWYALLTASSASLKRGPGLVIGLGWVAGILVPSIAGVLSTASAYNAVAAAFYVIFRALSYLDPISYLSFHDTNSTIGTGGGLSVTATVLALAALCVAYIALSVLQWRRVEA